MEYQGKAELTLRCFSPFYCSRSALTHVHVTTDQRNDQVIIQFEAPLDTFPVEEIDVSLLGTVTTFVVYTSVTAKGLHEFHCYLKTP
jgi:hypothetical protein